MKKSDFSKHLPTAVFKWLGFELNNCSRTYIHALLIQRHVIILLLQARRADVKWMVANGCCSSWPLTCKKPILFGMCISPLCIQRIKTNGLWLRVCRKENTRQRQNDAIPTRIGVESQLDWCAEVSIWEVARSGQLCRARWPAERWRHRCHVSSASESSRWAALVWLKWEKTACDVCWISPSACLFVQC